MKKKIKYYSVATILSIVCDSVSLYMFCSIIKEHSTIVNISLGVLIVTYIIFLNLAFFLQAREEIKPKNQCFIMRLPGVVDNDNFDFPKLKY